MMTIKYTHPPIQLSQDEFNEIDYQVMGQAFALQNEIGNLWDESDYRHHLALMCTEIGREAYEEVCISVSHNGFFKQYFVDLLINGNIYELKAASSITTRHEAQTLNYLFLANTRHGKIINFRSDALKWRFVSTSLQADDRFMYSIKNLTWNPQEKCAQEIPSLLKGMMDDWGAYLSTNLYKEALCHFLGVQLENEHQRFIPLSPNTALHMSGLSAQKNNLRNNLQKYLNISEFNELLWINFDQNLIELSCLHHSA
jgi:GxxExxY protein